MLKFELNIADRKTLANRMEELMGIHPYYTRAPLYAYDIGNYTIDRDGNLLVEPENADAELLTTLLNEGLIRGGESIESTDDQPENTEPTENLTAEPVTEEEPDDTAEDGATEDEPDAEESERHIPIFSYNLSVLNCCNIASFNIMPFLSVPELSHSSEIKTRPANSF